MDINKSLKRKAVIAMNSKNAYVDYDKDKTFTSGVEEADENEIKRLLDVGKIKCAYASKKIISGNQIEIEIYPEFTRKEMKLDKSIKKKSSKAQKNLNDKNARKRLRRLLNTNFTDDDIWATLTYEDDHLPNDMKSAQKDMSNYIKRLNYQRKKLELPPAKYIYVSEFSEGKKKIRCHHHLIISGDMSMDLVESIWKKGRRNNTRRIKKSVDGLTGLAEYISKDPKGKKRWCSSKNLEKPKVYKNHRDFSMKKIREMIKNKNMIRQFVEAKYPGMAYLDEQAYYNAYNGRTYFYIQLAITDT